jgi:mono/diheme cytochrome c family protein
MRKITFSIVILFMVTAAWAAGPANTVPATTNVTYNKDVAPILNHNCAVCHRPGEIGPMSLMSYQEVRPWAKDIKEKVASRTMPPWFADPSHGKFSNDRRLSDQEIATLVSWVDGGMKEGDAKDLPATPNFTQGWNIGKPDVVFTMKEEYSVPADGVVDYQYFMVPTNFTEDHWIQGAEIRPGARSAVHHVIVFVQDPAGSTRPEAGVQLKVPAGANDRRAGRGGPGGGAATAAGRGRGEGGGNRGGGGGGGWMLIGTAPGDSGAIMKEGTGKLIKAGSTLMFQVHYTPNGKAVKDRTSIGLIFSKHAPEYEVKSLGVTNGSFIIPAGESEYRVESAAVFTEDAIVWSMFPHMHVRGKSFDYNIVYPDGHRELVLSVPKYDFNWQGSFRFAKPIEVPKGARLECTAYFDNSKGNKYNPDPTKDVKWGDQTWEEMMIGFMDYSVKSQRVAPKGASE